MSVKYVWTCAGTAMSLALVTASPIYAATVTLVAGGASEEVEDDLRSASLLLATDETADTQELISAARADYSRILAALYQNGLYSATISIEVDGREATSVSLLNAPDVINTIAISVDPGPVFTFNTAEVTPVTPDTELPEEFATGQTAATPVMREAVQAGVTGWRFAGHAKAEAADQSITANHNRQTVDARFTLAPGPRLVFGPVIVTNESRVRENRILEIAGLRSGDVFDPDAVSAAERRLRRSGAFRSAVVVEAEVPNADGSLDMLIQTEDAKRRRLGAGIELSSNNGLTLSGFWLHRNLFGGAERFRFDAEIGDIGTSAGGGMDYMIGATLVRPATWNADTNVLFSASLEDLDEPEFSSTVLDISGGVERIFSETLTGRVELGIYASETEDVFGERTFEHLIARAGVIWDTRDDLLNATSGYFADAEAQPYLGLGDSQSGFRFTGDLRGYYGLGEDARIVLAGRGQVGIVTGSDLDATPPDYLFYSGGGGTVRGQNFQSLGVEQDDDQLSGGRSFLGLSGEIRGRITDSIGLVGFYDYGYVSADSSPGSDGNSHSGAGLGLRYLTPLGPIRLDVAVPVQSDLEDDDEGVQFYIGIGQAF